MPFKRVEGGWRFDFLGMKTNTAADEMPPTKYPYAQNVRVVKSLQTRPGYEFLFATALLIETDCPLTSGEVGVAYTEALSGTGGLPPYTWTIDSGSLPSGLSLSAAGVITGTPTTAQVGSFVIKLTDSAAHSILKSCNLTILAAVDITTSCPLPDVVVNTAYDQQFAASGGVLPYVWSITAGALPTGVSMNSSGHVTGTPTVQGVSTFTVHVVDALGGVDSLSCQITVTAGCFDFTDLFNRANGPLGADWGTFIYVGSAVAPSIVSNQFACSDVAVSEVLAAVASNITGYAEVTWTGYTSVAWGGPMVLGNNVLGPNYFYYAIQSDDRGGAEPRGRLRIVKFDGTLTVLATFSPTQLNPGLFGTPVRLAFNVQPTKVTLTAYINGIQVLTVDDSTAGRFQSGKVGIAISTSASGTANSWDNFVCHTCPA